MVQNESSGPEHPEKTRRHNYRYIFYKKHHKAGVSREAQWLLPPKLDPAEEFLVFDSADNLELSDADGNLFALRPKAAGRHQELGTRGEQIAKFPITAANQAWHGYPIWPIATQRAGENLRPIPAEVLEKMVTMRVIDSRESRRLRKGDHI
jgi:hypothetical protein